MNRLTLTLLLLCSVAVAGFAQSAGTAPAAAPASKPDLTWGGDFRLRFERYENVQTLSSSAAFNMRDYFRGRLRVWADYTPSKEFSVFGRVSAEPRYWYNAASVAAEGEEWKYAIIDNVYAKWNTAVSGTPTTLIVGRQDMKLGDGWLVSDGTPGDGSWTNHFDGARATFDVKDIKTKFDVILFQQKARPGDTLPVLGREGSYTLMEQDEIGAILYASNKSIKDVVLDGYFIYKGDDRVVSAGNEGDSYTLGARVAGTPSKNWQYSAELAYQWGDRDLQVRYPLSSRASRDINAWGFISNLTYLFKDTRNNQVTFLAEYLSGDDPDTADKDEMFDVLWSRTPRVGETWAVAYSLESGGRNAQYNNMFRAGATWTIQPTKDSSIATTWFAMFAPEKVPTRATNAGRFSRDSSFRGNTFQVVAKQKFTKEISGLLLAEATVLGDYYTNHDTITFLRAELTYSF